MKIVNLINKNIKINHLPILLINVANFSTPL